MDSNKKFYCVLRTFFEHSSSLNLNITDLDRYMDATVWGFEKYTRLVDIDCAPLGIGSYVDYKSHVCFHFINVRDPKEQQELRDRVREKFNNTKVTIKCTFTW